MKLEIKMDISALGFINKLRRPKKGINNALAKRATIKLELQKSKKSLRGLVLVVTLF